MSASIDPARYEREAALNRTAYESLREQTRREHAGRSVALGLGQVLAAADTYDEAMDAVRQLRPVPDFFLAFPADEEPVFEPYYDF
jgi:hypothetical protein